jgi:hypothetical protein
MINYINFLRNFDKQQNYKEIKEIDDEFDKYLIERDLFY